MIIYLLTTQCSKLDWFGLFLKPEYIALLISVLTIITTVYIAWRNRKFALAKEEYFKLQQVVERIDAKLLFLENRREKLRIFFQGSFNAVHTDKDFVDINNTFDIINFEKDGEEVAALIDIYFPVVSEKWNECLEKMNQLFTIVFLLKENIKNNIVINWEEKSVSYNEVSLELGEKPKEIAIFLKNELRKFKQENL